MYISLLKASTKCKAARWCRQSPSSNTAIKTFSTLSLNKIWNKNLKTLSSQRKEKVVQILKTHQVTIDSVDFSRSSTMKFLKNTNRISPIKDYSSSKMILGKTSSHLGKIQMSGIHLLLLNRSQLWRSNKAEAGTLQDQIHLPNKRWDQKGMLLRKHLHLRVAVEKREIETMTNHTLMN